MRELALFAGAGGGILGGKLLGWRTVCAVEIDTYCRSVLLARQRDGMLDPFPIWDDVLTLMERAGFTATCHGGSHYMFEHTSGYRFRMSKTHPSGILKPYQIRDAIQALRCVGEDGDS